jgi:3-carboxy-cis,cis-muconate cycloisomerase
MSTSPLVMWGFSTPEMAEVFSAASVVAAMTRFEHALVLALIDVGLAPEDEAAAAAAACESPTSDPDAILDGTWATGSPVIPLVDEIRERVESEDGRSWIHYGSTTQDVIDTAHMLLSARGLALLLESLERSATIMRSLTLAHRDTPQMGRTFLQHARPTSFGLRVLGWLDPTLGHIERLRGVRAQLPVQLGGPVGDRAPYGMYGGQIASSIAQRLGLRATDIAWHSDRSVVRAMAGAVGNTTGTMAKVATDVALLAQSDVAEVSVRPGGSSSMSGKQNPIDAIRARAAADVAMGVASMIERAGPIELDRGLGAWHAEWVTIPSLFQASSACLDAIENLLGSISVDEEAMARRAGPDSEAYLESIDARQFDSVMTRYDSIVAGE